MRDVTISNRDDRTALSKRESENCVRELEEKILKINQEPEPTRGGKGTHVSTKKRLPLRARAKSRSGPVPPPS